MTKDVNPLKMTLLINIFLQKTEIVEELIVEVKWIYSPHWAYLNITAPLITILVQFVYLHKNNETFQEWFIRNPDLQSKYVWWTSKGFS